MELLNKYLLFKKGEINNWITKNYLNVAIFNIVLVFLFLLRSAGYFDPYLLLSVNLIVLTGLILSIFLLGARSRAMFTVAILFWIFATFLKIVKVDVWAERTAIYVYQSFVIGVVLIVFENVYTKLTKRKK